VLRGASHLLGYRHIAWQLEIAPYLLAAAGTSTSVLYDLCADRFTHFIDLGEEGTASASAVRRSSLARSST
jgi:hypothetical protein